MATTLANVGYLSHFLTPDKMLSEMKRVSRTRFSKGKNDTYVISVETRDVYFSSSTIVMLTLVYV